MKEWRLHLESLPAVLGNHPFMDRVKELPPSLKEAFKDFLDDIAYIIQEKEEDYMSNSTGSSRNTAFLTASMLSGYNYELMNTQIEDELNMDEIPFLPASELVLPVDF